MDRNTQGTEAMMQEQKRQLVKVARMYAMCQKGEVDEPQKVTGLALAAFEDISLERAFVFMRSNDQNIKDLAWAFRNSNTTEEFEQRVKEIKNLPNGGSQS